MDIEHARFNMVEQQIRPWEVLDPRVLELLLKVHREDFIEQAHKDLAFADLEIPIGHGQFMLSPKLEARVLQELAINPGDHVLEIGTGSGYMTALLAHQASHVTSVDIVPEFISLASTRLAQYNLHNVTLRVADAAQGLPDAGLFDVIVLTGSTPVMPPSFLQQLKPGGRLFAVVGEAPVMQAQLLTSAGHDAFATVHLFETVIPTLQHALQRLQFVF